MQSLDTITVAASKTEERAIDALAPVSVVTLEQIQGRQASTVGDLLYNMPGVWVQDRGDEPSTSINIRGLQDFGRVAVVVDGARQNYQRTGHFANGSFFLNPELIGGIDIVRGPTANIYGSGAIGGVASFRTKDIQDVVRPGERWGVDINNVIGTNQGRALTFGVRRRSRQSECRRVRGRHLQHPGKLPRRHRLRSRQYRKPALGRPRQADGSAGGWTRGQARHHLPGRSFQRWPAAAPRERSPNSTNPNGTNNLNGTSIYQSDVKNYTTTLGWKYSQPEDKLFDWDAKVYWNRTENDQIKTATPARLPTPRYCGPGVPGNPVSGCIGTTAVTCSTPLVSTSTTPRVSRPGIPGATRSPTAWMRSRTR